MNKANRKNKTREKKEISVNKAPQHTAVTGRTYLLNSAPQHTAVEV